MEIDEINIRDGQRQRQRQAKTGINTEAGRLRESKRYEARSRNISHEN